MPLKTCFKIVRVTQDAGNQQKSLAEADRYPNFMTTGHHGIVQAPQLPKSTATARGVKLGLCENRKEETVLPLVVK